MPVSRTSIARLRALPIELQRMALRNALRTAIEVRDFSGADRIVNELDTIGVPPEMEPSIAVLVGRLKEALGRSSDALTNYRVAADSRDRRAAAQGRLREILLRYAIGDMPRNDVVNALETLTTIWRGDETEAEGLKLLAHLYTEDNRYRDAFHVMRTALLVHPNSDFTRQIQDEAAVTFDSLFLGGKGDALPPIEALGLFYDFRDLTPIGRRGDEMIRRLADRLVAVDLLDQAAELLQHQVDHRLQGARARAGRDPPRRHLSHEPQAGARARHLARDPHGGAVQRAARPAPAVGGARFVRHRPPRPGAGIDRQYRKPRGDAAAFRHPVGGAALARRRRADRGALWRALARVHAAERDRAVRHPARGDRLCARRGADRAGALPREIRRQDGGYARTAAPSTW